MIPLASYDMDTAFARMNCLRAQHGADLPYDGMCCGMYRCQDLLEQALVEKFGNARGLYPYPYGYTEEEQRQHDEERERLKKFSDCITARVCLSSLDNTSHALFHDADDEPIEDTNLFVANHEAMFQQFCVLLAKAHAEPDQ